MRLPVNEQQVLLLEALDHVRGVARDQARLVVEQGRDARQKARALCCQALLVKVLLVQVANECDGFISCVSHHAQADHSLLVHHQLEILLSVLARRLSASLLVELLRDSEDSLERQAASSERLLQAVKAMLSRRQRLQASLVDGVVLHALHVASVAVAEQVAVLDQLRHRALLYDGLLRHLVQEWVAVPRSRQDPARQPKNAIWVFAKWHGMRYT